MDEHELRRMLKRMLDEQRFAVLATQGITSPYTSLVAFNTGDDLQSVFFATTRATRKYANLQSNNRVSVLVDNRSNNSADLRQAMAATIIGSTSELEGLEKEQNLEPYLVKHPSLHEFVYAPTCAFLVIRVEKYIVVNRFQNVNELRIQP